MRKFGSLALAAAGALVLVACSDAPTGAPAVDAVNVELDARPGGGGGGGGGGGSATDPTATFIFPANLAAGVESGLLSDGGGDYMNGKCGVEAKIFATEAASNSGDATLNTKKGKCVRKLNIVFGPGDVEQVRVFVNVKNIHNTTTILPIGGKVNRPMNVNPWEGSRCENLLFRSVLQDGVTSVPGDSVTVERTASDTWKVYNDAGSAACALSDGTYVEVPLAVDFTIISSVPLPTP